MKTNKNYMTGFTMIETMVVATIFSIIAVGLGTSFLSGMKIWGRAKNTDFYKYFAFLDLEKTFKELRQAIDVKQIGFQGDKASLSFPGMIEDSIFKVSYKYDPKSMILSRSQLSLEDFISGREKDKIVENKFLTLEELSLSYLSFDQIQKKYLWVDTWTKDKGVFYAVRLQFKIKGEEFTKTIFLPISY